MYQNNKKMITLFKENLFADLIPCENNVYPITENLSNTEYKRIISEFQSRVKKITLIRRKLFLFLFVIYVLSTCFLLIIHKLDQFDNIDLDIEHSIIFIHIIIIIVSTIIYGFLVMIMSCEILLYCSFIQKEGLKFELIRSIEKRGCIKITMSYNSPSILVNWNRNVYINLKITNL